MAKQLSRAQALVWLRRAVQAGVFAFFIYLVLKTTEYPINTVDGPVTFFFDINPLVLLSAFVAAHAIPAALLLSLITVAVTLIFGRWFCGWFCPFGALHNFFTWLRNATRKQRIDQGGYTIWHRGKYYILIGFLAAAALGVNAFGWLDPFSFFFRSLALAVLPAINHLAHGFFIWVYEVDPSLGPLKATAFSEPAYDFMRRYFLDFEPVYFYGATLVGTLFLAVVALNFFRARFWCRYICPLGALLGVIGKNPAVRIHRVAEDCNDCGLCVADCQGGAEPRGEAWKPAECFYCLNCEAACPHDALSLRIGGRRDA